MLKDINLHWLCGVTVWKVMLVMKIGGGKNTDRVENQARL
jgi:hypothetical protein